MANGRGIFPADCGGERRPALSYEQRPDIVYGEIVFAVMVLFCDVLGDTADTLWKDDAIYHRNFTYDAAAGSLV